MSRPVQRFYVSGSGFFDPETQMETWAVRDSHSGLVAATFVELAEAHQRADGLNAGRITLPANSTTVPDAEERWYALHDGWVGEH